MNAASKLLKKQRSRALRLALQGAVLAVLASFIGFKLITEGLGPSAGKESGKAALFMDLMRKLFGDRPDLDRIAAYLMAGVMLLAALYGIFCLIRGVLQRIPARTLLGSSLLQQAGRSESLSDTLTAIDTDMAQSAKTFGEVQIGREWILEAQAMRLSRIRGVFWIDGKNAFLLCCADDAGHIWTGSFSFEDDRAHAVTFLKSRFPDYLYGDKNAYLSYLRAEKPEI